MGNYGITKFPKLTEWKEEAARDLPVTASNRNSQGSPQFAAAERHSKNSVNLENLVIP
jgi:hypothetical protein